METAQSSVQESRQGRKTAQEVLLFVHVPKTGGLTMEHLIRRQYPRRKAVWMTYQYSDQVNKFLAMSSEEKARLRCVMGHIPYGFHRFLPEGNFVYATLLREPLVRFVSEYRYLVRHPTPGVWLPPPEAMSSLASYLDYRIETGAMNVQTRIISGHFPEAGAPPPFSPLPAEAIEEAKRNLREHFAVVGVTEHFDETLLLLKRRMGWTRSVRYSRRNAAPERSTLEGLPASLVDRIREHTRMDAELADFAKTLLTEAVAREGEGFQRELATLRRSNHRVHLILNGWKSTPLWKLRDLPGIRQGRRLIGELLVRHL